MSNKNENNFCIVSAPEGLLKLDIMVHKANVLTYILSCSEKFAELQKTDFMMKRLNFGIRYSMSNKNETNILQICYYSSLAYHHIIL